MSSNSKLSTVRSGTSKFRPPQPTSQPPRKPQEFPGLISTTLHKPQPYLSIQMVQPIALQTDDDNFSNLSTINLAADVQSAIMKSAISLPQPTQSFSPGISSELEFHRPKVIDGAQSGQYHPCNDISPALISVGSFHSPKKIWSSPSLEQQPSSQRKSPKPNATSQVPKTVMRNSAASTANKSTDPYFPLPASPPPVPFSTLPLPLPPPSTPHQRLQQYSLEQAGYHYYSTQQPQQARQLTSPSSSRVDKLIFHRPRSILTSQSSTPAGAADGNSDISALALSPKLRKIIKQQPQVLNTPASVNRLLTGTSGNNKQFHAPRTLSYSSLADGALSSSLRILKKGVKLELLLRLCTYITSNSSCDANWTTEQVCNHLIKPWTERYKCSFEEMMWASYRTTPHPVLGLVYEECFTDRVNTFVSHTWSSRFVDLVHSLKMHSSELSCAYVRRESVRTMNPDTSTDLLNPDNNNEEELESFYEAETAYMWVDLLVVNQWNKLQLDKTWSINFQATIADIGHTLVIVPTWDGVHKFAPLLRSWCLWEILCSISSAVKLTLQMPISLRADLCDIMNSEDATRLVEVMTKINIQTSESTFKHDKAMIIDFFQCSDGGLAAANGRITEWFREWLLSLPQRNLDGTMMKGDLDDEEEGEEEEGEEERGKAVSDRLLEEYDRGGGGGEGEAGGYADNNVSVPSSVGDSYLLSEEEVVEEDKEEVVRRRRTDLTHTTKPPSGSSAFAHLPRNDYSRYGYANIPVHDGVRTVGEVPSEEDIRTRTASESELELAQLGNSIIPVPLAVNKGDNHLDRDLNPLDRGGGEERRGYQQTILGGGHGITKQRATAAAVVDVSKGVGLPIGTMSLNYVQEQVQEDYFNYGNGSNTDDNHDAVSAEHRSPFTADKQQQHQGATSPASLPEANSGSYKPRHNTASFFKKGNHLTSTSGSSLAEELATTTVAEGKQESVEKKQRKEEREEDSHHARGAKNSTFAALLGLRDNKTSNFSTEPGEHSVAVATAATAATGGKTGEGGGGRGSWPVVEGTEDDDAVSDITAGSDMRGLTSVTGNSTTASRYASTAASGTGGSQQKKNSSISMFNAMNKLVGTKKTAAAVGSKTAIIMAVGKADEEMPVNGDDGNRTGKREDNIVNKAKKDNKRAVEEGGGKEAGRESDSEDGDDGDNKRGHEKHAVGIAGNFNRMVERVFSCIHGDFNFTAHAASEIKPTLRRRSRTDSSVRNSSVRSRHSVPSVSMVSDADDNDNDNDDAASSSQANIQSLLGPSVAAMRLTAQLQRVTAQRELRVTTAKSKIEEYRTEIATATAAGDLDVAERLLTKALTIGDKYIGKEDLVTLRLAEDLASLTYSQGELKKSGNLYKRLYTAYATISGPEHDNTLNAAKHLANIFRLLGKKHQAEVLYIKTLKSFLKTKGVDAIETLEVVEGVAILLMEDGRFEKGIKTYKRALAGYERTMGLNHPTTLAALATMGEWYLKMGHATEARIHSKKAFMGFAKVLGKDNLTTFAAAHTLGNAYFAEGSIDRAEVMYQLALRARDNLLGSDDPDTLTTAFDYSIMLQAAGRPNEAIALLQRVVEGRKEVLGVEHVDTLAAVDVLERVRESEETAAHAEA